jgi:hypothetical protein
MLRRKRWGTPVGKFDAALVNLQKLEYTTIKTMVTPAFSMDQLLHELYGDHVVTTLRAAFPIIQERDRSPFTTETLSVTGVTPLVAREGVVAFRARLIIEARKARMLVPEENTMMASIHTFTPLTDFLKAFAEQHIRFEKVGNVIRWLNKYATPGAAMNYCPWIKSLLPSDHEIHTLRGGSYREPTTSVGLMINNMRECADIVAAALFLGDRPHDTGGEMIRVALHGARTDWDTDTLTNYVSQSIGFELT